MPSAEIGPDTTDGANFATRWVVQGCYSSGQATRVLPVPYCGASPLRFWAAGQDEIITWQTIAVMIDTRGKSRMLEFGLVRICAGGVQQLASLPRTKTRSAAEARPQV